MSDHVAVAEPVTETPQQSSAQETPAPEAVADPAPPQPVTTADLLVEEVSIDGMCGVY